MTTLVEERRFAAGSVEIRAAAESAAAVAVGYAAVFGRRSLDLGGFFEVIDPAAFNKTVQEADVVALWNHEERDLLGRVAAGTLRLAIDGHGLGYEIDLPSTSAGRDVQELLRRGDVTGSSFGFRTIRDKWDQDDQGTVTRTLLEVALIDVSPVSRPAYLDTAAALRSLAQHTHHTPAEVAAAVEARNLSLILTPPGAEIPPAVDPDLPAEESIGWLHA